MIFARALLVFAIDLALTQSLVMFQRTGLVDPYPNMQLNESSVLQATNFTHGISICVRWNYKQADRTSAIFHSPGLNLGFVLDNANEAYRLQFGHWRSLHVHESAEENVQETFFINARSMLGLFSCLQN